MRNLILIFGDQLDFYSSVFDDFDKNKDQVWMAEADEEFTYLWTNKYKIVFFLSAMRHFREALQEKQIKTNYHQMNLQKSKDRGKTLEEILRKDIHKLKPDKLVMVHPGDYRVLEKMEKLANSEDIELEIREDIHFYYSLTDFQKYSTEKKGYLLENFYREVRKKFDVLMDGKHPEGGDWNYDKENRASFNKKGPGKIKNPRSFTPDNITNQVIDLVKKRYKDHPGSLNDFDLPVTRKEALSLIRDFIIHRLEYFGRFQDAMWTDETFLYHSRISALLNIKLISPKEVIEKVTDAYNKNNVPLNSVEGFVRQVLGWREFMRGIYWNEMPEYISLNFFNAKEKIPPFYWDGETNMECIHQSMQSVINYGYAHHIQRLMVLGLFALLYGVDPKKFHEWHMAMYNDAIDWVSLPNALGMSQYGDGGIVGTKPYTASANYINKMSNYCRNCHYSHRKITEEDACPFNALYWDFLDRNKKKLKDINRMNLQMNNLNKKGKDQLKKIQKRAKHIKDNIKEI